MICQRKNKMNESLDRKKVILGLSGGVDSTTAALLLKEKGMEVTGLYFDVSSGNEEGRRAAEAAADQIGIPFLYRNVHQLFQDTVIDNFCSEYAAGRTPNPCVFCNPTVKFKILTQEADRAGAFHIATGHYARTAYNSQLGWTVRRAASEKKDQSYMLYRLPAEVIERLLLPLALMEHKEQAREIARQNHMNNADLKDSQEICFIADDENYADYIKRHGYSIEEGDFIDKEGNVLGRHKGLIHYTIGQRKGLGITFGKPVFVTDMDPAANTVTLGDHEDLFSREVICSGSFFSMTGSSCMPEILEGARVMAKIRYAARPAPAQIMTKPDGRILTVFDEKQRAATPGQSIVFYLDDCVVGGGFIE